MPVRNKVFKYYISEFCESSRFEKDVDSYFFYYRPFSEQKRFDKNSGERQCKIVPWPHYMIYLVHIEAK